MNTSIKSIKKLGEAIKCVNDAYCKLESELLDNCNAQQLNILRETISGACDVSTDPLSAATGDTDFDKWIDAICKHVKISSTRINDIRNISVNVAGVNALVDYTNLKSVGEALKNEAEELDKDVNTNITFTQDETKKACEALTTSIDGLSTKGYEEQKANLRKKALYKVCHFVTQNNCETDLTWDDIKTNINNLLCKGDGTKPTPAPRPKPKPTAPKPKASKGGGKDM